MTTPTAPPTAAPRPPGPGWQWSYAFGGWRWQKRLGDFAADETLPSMIAAATPVPAVSPAPAASPAPVIAPAPPPAPAAVAPTISPRASSLAEATADFARRRRVEAETRARRMDLHPRRGA